MRFKDKGDFGTLSTFVQPQRKAIVMRTSTVEKVDESGAVTQPKGIKVETEVPCQVANYTPKYGGVDTSDAALSYLWFGHGSRAKGRPRPYLIKFWGVDADATQNGWRLYRALQSEGGVEWRKVISLRSYVQQLWPALLERAASMGFVPKHARGRKPQVARHFFLMKLDDPTVVHLPEWKSLAVMPEEDRARCSACGKRTRCRCPGCSKLCGKDVFLCNTLGSQCFTKYHQTLLRDDRFGGSTGSGDGSEDESSCEDCSEAEGEEDESPAHPARAAPPRAPPTRCQQPPPPPPPPPPLPTPQLPTQPPPPPPTTNLQCRNATTLARTNPLPDDGKITFVEDGHKYTVYGAPIERSCTGVMGAYFAPFDPVANTDEFYPAWQREYSRGNQQHKYYSIIRDTLAAGGSHDDAARAIRASWEAKGVEAARLGTLLHTSIASLI